MKHNVPSDDSHTGPSLGVKKTQSHKNNMFTWYMASERALGKKLYRAINLARCNPDYQLKYPSECRENPDKKVLLECHIEATKRITHDHELICRLRKVPTIVRPARLNRAG